MLEAAQTLLSYYSIASSRDDVDMLSVMHVLIESIPDGKIHVVYATAWIRDAEDRAGDEDVVYLQSGTCYMLDLVSPVYSKL